MSNACITCGNRPQSAPIGVVGMGGVGKTTLVRAFFDSLRDPEPVSWLDLQASPDPFDAAKAFVEALYRDRRGSSYVVIDEADGLTAEQIEDLTRCAFNLKRIRALIFVARYLPPLGHGEVLALRPLSDPSAAELLRRLRSALSADANIADIQRPKLRRRNQAFVHLHRSAEERRVVVDSGTRRHGTKPSFPIHWFNDSSCLKLTFSVGPSSVSLRPPPGRLRSGGFLAALRPEETTVRPTTEIWRSSIRVVQRP